jgi:hypothetical protein
MLLPGSLCVVLKHRLRGCLQCCQFLLVFQLVTYIRRKESVLRIYPYSRCNVVVGWLILMMCSFLKHLTNFRKLKKYINHSDIVQTGIKIQD